MNKLQSQRYSSYNNSLPFNSLKNDQLKLKNINKTHAITMLTQKQTQINIIKRRISALCVRQTKTTNKTINNQMQINKRHHIRNESLQIKLLLQNQRKKDTQRLEQIKNRNLQSRVDNYYKTKNLKLNQLQQKRQITSLIKSKSKQNNKIINQNKEIFVKEKYNKSRSIYQFQKLAKQQRTRFLQDKKKSISNDSYREAQHILQLGQIKNHQLNELGKLQLLMVQRNTSSKMAYQASIDRLEKISSNSSRRNSSYFNSRYTATNSARGKSTIRAKQNINLN